MTLDMLKVSPQVVQMGGDLAERFALLGPRLAQARAALEERAADWEALADVSAASKRRLAVPLEPLDARHAAPTVPPNHIVIATDGSQIEPDRHGPADFFLLNVGWVVIRYGAEPFAELASEPWLYYGPEQTYIERDNRRVPIQEHLLSAKRAGEEIGKAADLADRWSVEDLPTVVLADGTLLLWVLEDRPTDFLREELVGKYVDGLDHIQVSGVPVASYISRSRSTEVSGLLLESDRRGDLGRCEPCAADDESCVFDRLPDRELFRGLAYGERSGLFAMTLPDGLKTLYRDHAPCFFYLNVGSEVGRVEVPSWMADDSAALGLVQTVILDQCQKGLGYPNALARAHEQAVVSGPDRLAFEYLLESVLAQQNVPVRPSEKAYSKRVRAV